jgi:hypothetical protein
MIKKNGGGCQGHSEAHKWVVNGSQEVDEGMSRVSKMHMGRDAMATKKHIKGFKNFFFGHWEGHWRMTMAPRSMS